MTMQDFGKEGRQRSDPFSAFKSRFPQLAGGLCRSLERLLPVQEF
jgi:hypothetical protein